MRGPDSNGAPSAAYPDEEIYDTQVHPDEALDNVRVANHRWPDCTTNRTAIQDMFRIEGAAEKGGQEKALALWKWFTILVSGTGGGHIVEGVGAQQVELIRNPHKILTVYGHQWCDGQAWSMVSLWSAAAGYIAFDECHPGHTIASLGYKDEDGQFRFHDLDPQRRYYHWDSRHKRISTWSMPVMRGLVFRHLVVPQHVHTLRTSLRVGDTVDRRWDNEGRVLFPGDHGKKIELDGNTERYYGYKPGRKDGVYSIAGEEVQTFEADMTPQRFAQALFTGSSNVACTSAGPGRAALHPEKAGVPAQAIDAVYRYWLSLEH